MKTAIPTLEEYQKLVWIGFGNSSDCIPSVWRQAKRIIEMLVDSWWVVPYNYGRGKGKYTTAEGVTIEDILTKCYMIVVFI